MKIIVTGSLGYVSTPLTKELIKKGHSVTVVSSKADKQAAIEALGAKAAIGSMEDADFLADTFNGADAVYCMLAVVSNFGDPNNNADALIKRGDAIAHNYVQAVERSGVKRIVYLSSIGANMEKNSGLIINHHHTENTLNKLPADINISFIRPCVFYRNLFAFIPTIKNQGNITSMFGVNERTVFVSAIDIADAIVEELESDILGQKVRYVASEELTGKEVADILGAAIGVPELKWVSVSDKEQFDGYKAFGMNDSLASQYVEMNASIHNGKFYEDYDRNRPKLGKVKLKEFAKEFAGAYHQQQVYNSQLEEDKNGTND